MDIKFPTNLTQFELYSLASKVISDYELDSTNLSEYPIRVFNKVNETLGLTIDGNYLEELERIFTEKGSFEAVKRYFDYLGMPATIDQDSELNMVMHINIDQLTNLDFLKYVPDAVSYLIFFNELKVTVEKLISTVELQGAFSTACLGLDVMFSDLEYPRRVEPQFDKEFY